MAIKSVIWRNRSQERYYGPIVSLSRVRLPIECRFANAEARTEKTISGQNNAGRKSMLGNRRRGKNLAGRPAESGMTISSTTSFIVFLHMANQFFFTVCDEIS